MVHVNFKNNHESSNMMCNFKKHIFSFIRKAEWWNQKHTLQVNISLTKKNKKNFINSFIAGFIAPDNKYQYREQTNSSKWTWPQNVGQQWDIHRQNVVRCTLNIFIQLSWQLFLFLSFQYSLFPLQWRQHFIDLQAFRDQCLDRTNFFFFFHLKNLKMKYKWKFGTMRKRLSTTVVLWISWCLALVRVVLFLLCFAKRHTVPVCVLHQSQKRRVIVWVYVTSDSGPPTCFRDDIFGIF